MSILNQNRPDPFLPNRVEPKPTNVPLPEMEKPFEYPSPDMEQKMNSLTKDLEYTTIKQKLSKEFISQLRKFNDPLFLNFPNKELMNYFTGVTSIIEANRKHNTIDSENTLALNDAGLIKDFNLYPEKTDLRILLYPGTTDKRGLDLFKRMNLIVYAADIEEITATFLNVSNHNTVLVVNNEFTNFLISHLTVIRNNLLLLTLDKSSIHSDFTPSAVKLFNVFPSPLFLAWAIVTKLGKGIILPENNHGDNIYENIVYKKQFISRMLEMDFVLENWIMKNEK